MLHIKMCQDSQGRHDILKQKIVNPFETYNLRSVRCYGNPKLLNNEAKSRAYESFSFSHLRGISPPPPPSYPFQVLSLKVCYSLEFSLHVLPLGRYH